MRETLDRLQDWYFSHCDSEWEHGYGIKIDTLDNPGWTICVDLKGTNAEKRTLDLVKLDRNDADWIQYWVEKKQFRIACGPKNLTESLDIFLSWVDQK